MQRTKAPFRADEVGSLLRPQRIKEARARLEKGEITADDLRKVEDIEIEKVVHKQASIGLKLATDGEFRRSWWHFDFLSQARPAASCFTPTTGIQFAGVETRQTRSASSASSTSRRSSDAGALQVPEEARRHRACHAEDDDPVAGGAAFPRRPQGDLEGGLSRTSRSSSSISARPIARRSRRSTTPAAATCSSTTRCGPISARRTNCRRRASAATIPTACSRSMRASSTTRSPSGRPTW